MKSFFVFATIFSFNFLSLQAQISTEEIDQLMDKGKKFSLAYKSAEALKISGEVLKRSTETNYKSGIIRGNIMLAYEFRNIGDYGKSLAHIYAICGQFKDSVDNNPKLNATLLSLIGDNYLEMGLKKEAIQTGRKLISVADRFKSKDESYGYKRSGYGLIYSSYKNENKDSVYYYLMQAKYWEDGMEKLTNPKSKLLRRSMLSFSIANYYIEYTKHYDSAYYYINKGIARRGSNHAVPYKTDQLIGKILIKQGKYVQALPYLASALKDAREKAKIDEITSIYKLTAQLYAGVGDQEKQEEFQHKAILHTDSIQQARSEIIQTAVELIKQAVQYEMKARQHRILRYWLFVGVGIILVSGAYFFLKDREETKVRLMSAELKFSNNTTFMEIIALAKNNDPAFLGRFKDVYSQFCEELIERYPGILNSELAFCAYLKLNFTTKDIAAYTFVTPSAVRNRKNRMKKKFGIPVHADIYGWIDKIPKN